MGLTLSQIASNTAQVSFSVNGEDVHITYYPGRVTEKTVSAFNAFSTMDQASMMAGFETFNETLVHLIKEWDVFEDDAQTVMYPLDAHRFAELPLGFRIQVVTAIMGDIRPETLAPQTMS